MQITSIRYLNKLLLDVKTPSIDIVNHNLSQTIIVISNNVDNFCMDQTIIKHDMSK